MMRRLTLLPTLLTALLLAGCSDDTDAETAAGGGSTTQQFPGCVAGDIEADLTGQDAAGNPVEIAWLGAGVDPDTGQLVAGDYIASTTYLQLVPDSEGPFNTLVEAILGDMFSNPGFVGVQFGMSQDCSTRRTLSVWQNEAAMMEFVTSDSHSAAIAAIPTLSRGASETAHWSASAGEIDWEAAATIIAANDVPLY